MSKPLHLSFLFVFFNLIQTSTLQIRPGVVAENVLKKGSAVDPEERDVTVIQNVTIDLCQQDFADLHADMTYSQDQVVVYQLTTTACNKNFTFYCLQSLQGYMVEAFQEALDNGTVINIVGTVAKPIPAPAGVIFVRITRQANTGSYHQLVASRNDYMVVSDSFIDNSLLGQEVQFPAGTDQSYILYQPANTTDGNNGIGLSYLGDCQSATIWKGLQQTESTRIYGGSPSVCDRTVYRDVQPAFVFGRFLTVAPGKPDNCTISYGYRRSKNELIYVYPNTAGTFNSPAYSTTYQPLQNGTHQVNFIFVTDIGIDRIYFQLFTLITGNSQLIITEKAGNTQIYTASDNLCSFSSTDINIQVTYQWSCGAHSCEDGLILKWSTTNPDTNVGNPISFVFTLSLIVFLANIFK